MIYLDSGATSMHKPGTVLKAVHWAMKCCANPGRGGHEASMAASRVVYTCRERAARMFGCKPEQVVFTSNCTHGLNIAIKSIIKPGSPVAVSGFEHNAVMRPIKKIGAGFDIAEVSLEDDSKTIAQIESKIVPNTKLVICTGASNVLGKILPIKQIGEICKRKGIYFALDAAQTAGVLPIDMKEMNIDFLCIAPHKGLYAPMGVGVLVCRKGIDNTIIEGGTGTNSIELTQPDSLPERIESGTVNLPAILGIGAGLDYVKHIGIDKIYSHEMMLINELYKGLKANPDIILYTPEPLKHGYVPVLSFNYRGLSSGESAEILSKNGIAVRGGLHCAPTAHKVIGTLDTGTVRVSVATFNNINEIKRLILLLQNKKIFKKV